MNQESPSNKMRILLIRPKQPDITALHMQREQLQINGIAEAVKRCARHSGWKIKEHQYTKHSDTVYKEMRTASFVVPGCFGFNYCPELIIQVAAIPDPDFSIAKVSIPKLLIHPRSPGSYLDNSIAFVSTSLAQKTSGVQSELATALEAPMDPTYHYSQFLPSPFLIALFATKTYVKHALVVIGSDSTFRADLHIEHIIKNEPSDTRLLIMVAATEPFRAITENDLVKTVQQTSPERISVFRWRPVSEILSLFHASTKGFFIATELYKDATKIGLPVTVIDEGHGAILSHHPAVLCSNSLSSFQLQLGMSVGEYFPNLTDKSGQQSGEFNANRKVMAVSGVHNEQPVTGILARQSRILLRKFRKLRESPLHFIQDSKLRALYRQITTF